MRKTGVIITIFLLLLSTSLILANNETNNTQTNRTISSSSNEDLTNKEKIEEGFDCLEKKAGSCTGLKTKEIALTILATPDGDVYDDCVDELLKRKASDNWGSVEDTAFAILALNHAGKDTEASEEWLLEQAKTPKDLMWYLEQDSNEATECHIGYDTNDYKIKVDTNKKIDSDAGPCLSRAQSNFWLRIDPDCYETEFSIACDRDYIATLVYRNKNSDIIYVLDDTKSSSASKEVTISVNSKCFGESSCNYETTAWATLALLNTGNSIEEFVPYLIAMSDTNEAYLPDAFIYMLTNYEDYAQRLVEDQEVGNYWNARNSAYNKYYDTALAILSLKSSSSKPVDKAKDWLLFSQDSNGCWQNSVRDTAIVLWALTERAGRDGGGGSTVYCVESGYFCIPKAECPTIDDVGDNYYCSALSDTCCVSEHLKECSEYGGNVCGGGEECIGRVRKSLDEEKCCVGECRKETQETECEAQFYTCMDSCSEFQEPVPSYSCNAGQICCRTKPKESSSGSLWIWILILLILAVAGVILWIKREKVKLLWFKMKSKFGKNKGGATPQGAPPTGPRPGPGVPPRGGMPQRPIPRRQGMPPQRPRGPSRQMPQKPNQIPKNQQALQKKDDTFSKLRDMSK